MRGSGRVGLLVREEVLERFTVEVLEEEVEDVLWVRWSQEEEDCLVLAVCCIPPESSSQGGGGGGRGRVNLPTAGRTGGEVW